MSELHVVTGAFGFTGRHIAQRLLDLGVRVRTLTADPDRPSSLSGRIEVAPLQFHDEQRLVSDLRGARVLYNTYWVRFPHGATTYSSAVRNSLTLLHAAHGAGVERVVHLSISNCEQLSPFEFVRAKAQIELAIQELSFSHAILRPALLFGDDAILINNIAWLLRRLPLFVVPGPGNYGIQPIFVGDLAKLAVAQATACTNATIDAIGPETFTFNELIELLAAAVDSRARVVHGAPAIALALSRGLGWARRDVMITRDELDGLMANQLVTQSRPIGTTKLSEWLLANASHLGHEYKSELARHYRQRSA